MPTLWLAVAVLCASLSTAQRLGVLDPCAVDISATNCTNITAAIGSNNIKIPDRADCSKYYRCTGRNQRHEQCEDGLLFDYKNGQCLKAQEAECLDCTLAHCSRTLPCFPGARYADESNCNRFYECNSTTGEWNIGICHQKGGPNGYNPSKLGCDGEIKMPMDCAAVCPTTPYTSTQGSTILVHTTRSYTMEVATKDESNTAVPSNHPLTTESPTAEQATTERATTEQATTEQATTERATTEQATTEQATTEQATTEQATAEQAITERATTEQATTEQATTEQATTERATTEQATTEQATTEQATTEQATTERATTEQATTEQATTEQATTEQATTEQATTEQATTEQATTEQATTEQATTERATTEQATTERATTEQATTEQATTEQATTERTTTEQATTEQATTEQATTEQATTEQATTEQATTEQATTEQTTTEQATTEQTTTERATTERATTELPTTEQKSTETFTTKSTTEEASDSTNLVTTELSITEADTIQSTITETFTTTVESLTKVSPAIEQVSTEAGATKPETTHLATTEAVHSTTPVTGSSTLVVTEIVTTRNITVEPDPLVSTSTESVTEEATATESAASRGPATKEHTITEPASTAGVSVDPITGDAVIDVSATVETTTTGVSTIDTITTERATVDPDTTVPVTSDRFTDEASTSTDTPDSTSGTSGTSVHTETTMVPPTVCTRPLPCTIGTILPDPNNCTYYYNCSLRPQSTETEWLHVRCVRKDAYVMFDTKDMVCKDNKTDEITCAASCRELSTPTFDITTKEYFYETAITTISYRNQTTIDNLEETTTAPADETTSLAGDHTDTDFTAGHTAEHTATPGMTTGQRVDSISNHSLIAVSNISLEGGDLKVNCSFVVDTGDYTISWYLDGYYIDFNNSKRITTEGSFIVFSPIKAVDSDSVLSCIVQTSANSKSSAYFVISVITKPSAYLLPRTVTAYPQQTVDLICSYHNHPLASSDVLWLKDDGRIYPVDITATSNTSTLHLRTIAIASETRYSCVVQNEAGATKSDISRVYVVPADTAMCPQTDVWPTTAAGVTSVVACPGSDTGYQHRTCVVLGEGTPQGGATWSAPYDGDCVDYAFTVLEEELDQMHDGIGSTRTNEISQRLVNLTSYELSAGELRASTALLTSLVNIHTNTTGGALSMEEMDNVVKSVSQIMSDDNFETWGNLEGEEMIQSVLLLMDTFTTVAAQHSYDNNIFIEDNLLLQMTNVKKNESRTLSLPKMDDTPQGWMFTQNDVITLSAETVVNIRRAMDVDTITVSSVYYRNLEHLFSPRASSDDLANSTFLNSRVLSLTVHGLPPHTILSPNVTINLTLTSAEHVNHTPTCVFWDAAGGGWSGAGCTVAAVLGRDRVSCQCNHLTNFAILMSPNPVDDYHQFVLGIISIVGCVVSIGGMLLTMLLYAVMWKHVKSHHAVVLLNLCLALIAANALFVGGVDRTADHALCAAIAALLHYFYLAAFCLMLVEGVELLLYTIFVFHVRRKRETGLLVLAAWCAPAVIVGVSLGVTRLDGYGTDRFCWLDVESGLLWAFVGPVLVIIAINMVIAVVVLRRVSGARLQGTVTQKKHRVRAALRNLLVILPVMGIAWLFGIFTVNDGVQNHVFQYIFVVANSLQGLFIFIFHALCNKKKKSGTPSTKTNRSHLKSDSSGKHSKKSTSTNGTSGYKQNSLPEYSYLYPESNASSNNVLLNGIDNPSFSSFRDVSPERRAAGTDQGTVRGQPPSTSPEKAPLHYVEEVTYTLDATLPRPPPPKPASYTTGKPRPASSDATTLC